MQIGQRLRQARAAWPLLAAAIIGLAAGCGPAVHAESASGTKPHGAATSMRDKVRRDPTPAWTTYHGSTSRWGYYPEQTIGGLRSAWTSPALDGDVYAEPIWQGGRVYVATENDTVYALSLQTGRPIWRRHLGTPVPLADLPCGDIDPLGITGTPVLAGSRLYVTAEVAPGRQRLFALDAVTGALLGSYSLDLAGTDPVAQQQRGALTYLGGTVYVPLGGLYGDCGAYVGQVVAVRPGVATFAYRVPTAREGAIWATAGLSVGPAGDLYAASGNSASLGRWDGGDSVLRLSPGLRLLSYFTPRNFAQLNAQDLDLGSTTPLPLPGGLVFQIGKEGTGYLLRSSSLGGIGHPLYSAGVCAGAYGGDAWNGRLLFVPCQDGLVALDVSGGHFSAAWRSAGWDAGPPAVGGGAVFSVDEGAGSLRVLQAGNGREITAVQLGAVPHFDSPTLAPGLVLVDAGRQVRAFALLPRAVARAVTGP